MKRSRDDNDPNVVASRERASAWGRDNPERRAAKMRAWRKANPERAKELNDDWRRRNPDKVRASARIKTLRQYSLTPESWQALFNSQGQRCACCGGVETSKKGWHTDHDHVTGAVRGVVCSWCNMGLGQFDDSPTQLLDGACYLDREMPRVDEHW